MADTTVLYTRLGSGRQKLWRKVAGSCRALLVISVLLMAACARLPEYARPHFTEPEEKAEGGPNSFGYRELKIEDYRAASLPEKYQQYDHSIQARSCISFIPREETEMRIHAGFVSGQVVYIGRFTWIGFRALFNPDCSWWNPATPPKRKKYVLQHEQIHFAIAELAARRINLQQIPELKEYMAIGNSVEEVKQELVDKAQELSHQGLEESMKLHTSFDEETSLYYNPRIQQDWYEKIQGALINEEKIPALFN